MVIRNLDRLIVLWKQLNFLITIKVLVGHVITNVQLLRRHGVFFRMTPAHNQRLPPKVSDQSRLKYR